MKLTGKTWCALIAGGLALMLLGAGLATVLRPGAAPVQPSPAPSAAGEPSAGGSAPSAPSTPEAPAAPSASPAPEGPAVPESSAAAPSAPAVPEGEAGLETAKAAALAKAGVAADQASWTKQKLEQDKDRWEYELEFWVGQVEYDYEIDAATGEIFQEKWEDHSLAGSTGDAGEAAAKAAALAHAGFSEGQVSALRAERELEHGLVEYEVQFWSGQAEYDYKVSGDGVIMEFEWELH